MFTFKSIKTEWPFWAGALLATALAASIATYFDNILAYILLIGATSLAGDLIYATLRWSTDYRTPWFIRTKSWLSWKWERFAAPLQYLKTPSGKYQLVRPIGWDFFEIYNAQGRLVGTEQVIDWNMSNVNLEDDRPENVQVLEKPASRSYQLSWFARWRSSKAIFVAEIMKVIEDRH